MPQRKQYTPAFKLEIAKLIVRAELHRVDRRTQAYRLGEKWDRDYPSIGLGWRRNWARIILFFDYPPEIRKVIYTTNAIESINMRLRKVIKTSNSLPTDEAVTKLFYLALRNISKKWTMPIKDWKASLNRFSIQFEERILSS